MTVVPFNGSPRDGYRSRPGLQVFNGQQRISGASYDFIEVMVNRPVHDAAMLEMIDYYLLNGRSYAAGSSF